MKKLIILIVFSFNLYAKVLNELNLDWSIYNDVEIQELMQTLEIEKKNDFIKDLQVSKIALLGGDANGAIKLLSQIVEKNQKNKLTLLAKRYLAIAYFSTGNFQETSKLLKDPRFSDTANFQKICLLKIASSLYGQYTDELKGDFFRCKALNFEYSLNDYVWLDYVENFKSQQVKDFKYYTNIVRRLGIYNKDDHLRSWLKFGLLLGNEKFVVDTIDMLPEKAFQNDILRTLIAYNLYRIDDKAQAKDFIEDINNSNAAYLKALLSSRDNDYKTSYAHILSSLNRRPYSINANLLLTANSWITGNYKNGRLALSKVIPVALYEREKRLLTTSFLVQEKKFQRASFEIERLYYDYNKKMPFEGLLLESYIYFNEMDNRWVQTSDTACIRYDGVNCWLHFQSQIWKDYHKDIKDFKKKDFKVTTFLEDLTQKKLYPKIQESIFIKQKDIIELDIVEDPYLEDMAENES
ncbi:hypothetical protein [Bacteriovorax sp. Seq25_V]|uniref:hypothetical protein n=1 Tax=Bacteriovorax sp. Seq25_V TaxID=1201288 RepID=UPI0012F99ABE|nr:hypothetical protein [Bacteriovorax sp. Seq25_V]